MYDAEQTPVGRGDDHVLDAAAFHSGPQLGDGFMGANGGGVIIASAADLAFARASVNPLHDLGERRQDCGACRFADRGRA